MSSIFKKRDTLKFQNNVQKIFFKKCHTDSVSLVLENHFQTKLIPIFDEKTFLYFKKWENSIQTEGYNGF